MGPVDRRLLLGREYWLVRSTPLPSTSDADIEAHVEAHLRWLLDLEADGTVLLSGPLISGPGVTPGAGVTVLRADDAAHATTIAASDPFVVAGLRTSEVFAWRVNEGSISLRVSLGTGAYAWE